MCDQENGLRIRAASMRYDYNKNNRRTQMPLSRAAKNLMLAYGIRIAGETVPDGTVVPAGSWRAGELTL